jgi:hypothetical protein
VTPLSVLTPRSAYLFFASSASFARPSFSRYKANYSAVFLYYFSSHNWNQPASCLTITVLGRKAFPTALKRRSIIAALASLSIMYLKMCLDGCWMNAWLVHTHISKDCIANVCNGIEQLQGSNGWDQWLG